MSEAHTKALHSRKLKVKTSRDGYGFDRSWKVLQGEARRFGDKGVYFKGHSKLERARSLKKKINPDDIPF